MRTIIIGDIHGCFTEFTELLEKCEIGSEDRLILLGDLMDRGPNSREVFEKVCELKESMGDRFYLVRGNHEEMLLDAIINKDESLWLDTIEERLEYEKWYCGHFHTMKKIDKLQFMYHDVDRFD